MEIRLKYADYSSKINLTAFTRNLLDFNVGSAVLDVYQLEKPLETKAFMLLFKATKNTFIKETKKLDQEKLNKSSSIQLGFIEIKIKDLFEEEIIITEDFFHNVLDHNKDYLSKTFNIFKAYLKALDIACEKYSFYDYAISFQTALEEEFNQEEEYQDLITHFNNPLITQNKNITNLLTYYKEIKGNYTRRLRDEETGGKETLKDLYVAPNFAVHKSNLKDTIEEQFKPFKKSIHDFLKESFLIEKQEAYLKDTYNMVFILGQPGQGKTSFCYKFIYDCLEDELYPKRKIIFLKIRDLISRDFTQNPLSTIKEQVPFDIDFKNDACLLVLDGLDEAYMSGGIKDDDLKYIYDKLNKTSKANKKLKVVLTSRINYLNLKDICFDGSLILSLEELNNKQIKSYSKKIDTFYPSHNFKQKIKEILKKEDEEYSSIVELLRQSVMLYFLAISNIDLKKDDTKVLLYKKLFESLAQRNWDKNGQLSYFNANVRSNVEKFKNHLRSYIRGIAFSIYQSKDLYITIDELMKLESTKLFITKCFDEELPVDDLKKLNKYLLISFYFQNNREDESAIEFFHNSLWEFLTAEYIWESYKKEVLKKDEDDDYVSVTLETYYSLLESFVGRKELSEEVILNLKEIIKDEEVEVKENIYKQTLKVFHKLSTKNYLLRYDYHSDELENQDKLKNIFLISWVLLDGVRKDEIIHTNENIDTLLFDSKIDFSYVNTFKQIRLSSFLQNYYFFFINFHNVEFDCDISSSFFDQVDFNDSKLCGDLFFLRIMDCDFKNVKISSTIIHEVIIEGCIFENIIFENVIINDLNLMRNFFKKNTIKGFDKEDLIIERIDENDRMRGYKVNSKCVKPQQVG